MAASSEELLAGLNELQREAASSLVGPTCILAGAGTGKTRTITHRIAYGVATGHFAPNRVLALTYTNRAAGEIRARLRALGIPGVQVRTFHAAALAQLEYFWPQLAGVPAPSILESKAKTIAEAAKTLGIDLDQAALREMASEIEWRKYSMIELDDYAGLTRRGNIAGLSFEKNVAVQAAYENLKIQRQRLDWEDVLILNLGMLKAEPRALSHVQSQYRFFTVDEYQDISPLQHALLDAWLGEHSELCVVGDANQTIYTFTGATSEYLRNFAERFEQAKLVKLTTNYRSSESILSVANRLTPETQLESPKQGGDAPRLTRYRTAASEAEGIAGEIARLREDGVALKEIAVLYRINSLSEPLERALTERGITFQLRGGERFFARPEIKSAIQLIRAESLAPTDKPLMQAVSDIVRSLGWQERAPIEAGPARSRWEALDALLRMLDELPREASIKDFALELADRAHSQHEPSQEAVTLSTIHAAKGLEWRHVFIVGLNEGTLPIGYAKTEAELAEERRLLYVGITRAMSSLRLSFVVEEGQRLKQPSRFLEQLRLKLTEQSS